MASVEAIRYSRGRLDVLNQLLLPYKTQYEPVATANEGWHQIHFMKVRGAPAIAVVAALSLAVELEALRAAGQLGTVDDFVRLVQQRWDYLKTSRPTAVNLFDAAKKLVQLVQDGATQAAATAQTLAIAYIEAAERMLAADVQDNKSMGKHGGDHLWALCAGEVARLPQPPSPPSRGLVLLTHCNTGSLATAGFGTALGVIRYLHKENQLAHVFCTETRPYNQGSRLTAYELVTEGIPSTLITDNMAAALMRTKGVSAIVVGADRVAANGDTANKIGTYQLAVLARHHNVPFFVIAPTTSIDLDISSGAEIPIEERKQLEVLQTTGAEIDTSTGKIETPVVLRSVQVGTASINVWNPAFDVTPSEFITGIVTERGVISKKRGRSDFDIRRFMQEPETPSPKRRATVVKQDA